MSKRNDIPLEDIPAARPNEDLRAELRAHQLEVTTLHISALRGQIQDVNSKLNYAMIAMGFVATLLIAKYGSTAWLTWRLMSALLTD